jgi:hypothetical protein
MSMSFVHFISIPDPRIGCSQLASIDQFAQLAKNLTCRLLECSPSSPAPPEPSSINLSRSKQFPDGYDADIHCSASLSSATDSFVSAAIKFELFSDIPFLVNCTFTRFVETAINANLNMRVMISWARPIGHPFAIRHPPANLSRGIFENNWTSASDWRNDIATLVWRYIICLWCHIFVDGNGSLARRFLAGAFFIASESNNDNYNLCLQLACNIHRDIRNQLVIMESQNTTCWLNGSLELISLSINKMIVDNDFPSVSLPTELTPR